MIKKFSGFQLDSNKFVRIPSQFFSQLLSEIDDLIELKTTLFLFWYLEQIEGDFRYIRESALLNETSFLASLSPNGAESQETAIQGLQKAVERGTLLLAELQLGEKERLYFLNTPKGQRAIELIEKGEWTHFDDQHLPIMLTFERPNIFKIYEEQVGPLTPMIADTLTEAEKSYPLEWIQEAFEISAENNVRKWRYVEAILESWKKEGKDDRSKRHQGNSEEDRKKYVEGKFSDFIEN